MKELHTLYNKNSFATEKESPCNGVKNITIIVHKKKYKKRKKVKTYKEPDQLIADLSTSNIPPKNFKVQKHQSSPTVDRETKIGLKNCKSSDTFPSKPNRPYRSEYVVNVMSERGRRCVTPYINPLGQTQWKIYRCQLNLKEESCCCSCNSDAMFEVMKSLYDCYKKKNCDNCNCILCGHLPREGRRFGEMRKASGRSTSIAVATVAEKERRKAEIKRLEKEIEGKPSEEKEKILEQAVMSGAPLPEGKTPSEKELIKSVRTKLGLPQEPKSAIDRERMRQAEAAGLIMPLEGKTPAEKEKILRTQTELGIPLPEGRTPSEKALIYKIKTSLPSVTAVHPAKLKKAKLAGFLTPLEGKSPEQKERILKGLVQHGIPLPEGKTSSEKKMIDKVRKEMGLPPEAKTPSMKEKHRKAAATGLLTPLEGKITAQKEKILTGQAQLGLPLPEGRTSSEKALINKIKASVKTAPSVPAIGVPSEKIRKAKAAGFLTPLEGKTPKQQEKILKGLAKHGIPLPEGKSASEKKIIDKVRKEMGLPPEPKTVYMKAKQKMAAAAGLLTPLEGKTAAQKEKILTAQAELGLPMPEGRTPSEKSMIDKIKATVKPQPSMIIPSEKIRKAKAAGFLTPLTDKTPKEKEKILKGLATHGIPLPEGKTPSEKKLIEKVRANVGLPPEPKTLSAKEKYRKAIAAGLITPLEGKTDAQKEKILKGQAELGLPLPEGRTPSEKALISKVKATTKPPSEGVSVSEKMRRAKAAGLLTPLQGKTPQQKQNIIKGLALQGLPLPDAKTSSEKKLVDKLRADLGLPPEPKTSPDRDKYERAQAAGLIVPLEGKSPTQKEKILTDIANMGIPLPEGRTKSEKALVAKVKAARRGPPLAGVPSERIKKARAAGLLTPLEGKTPQQREDIIKGLAMHGIPLPKAQTASEKKLVDKVRAELGLPLKPKSSTDKEKYARGLAAGVILPLEGKTAGEKEKILNDMADMGIPLPEGRTPSEKAIIYKVKAAPRHPMVHADKLRKARAAGLMTPLEGKTPSQKENILKGLAMHGIPLPAGKTVSEKKIVNKVRKELGLPPEPKTTSEKENYAKGVAAGIIMPLEGKSPSQKEKILNDMADMGIPLPEGRTPSETALIAKVEAAPRTPPIPSDRLRKAKAAGYLTPLDGKTLNQKEKILKGLAMYGIPLPEGHTPSEKKFIEKIRNELGLPPEPKTSSERQKYAKAMAVGVIVPLEGKTASEKEKILNDMADMGVVLPEGRTISEKALVAKVKAVPRAPRIPSEKLRKAKAAGLLTPLEGKTLAQREKIIKGLAMHGIPLPKGKTASEKKLIKKLRGDLGLPPEPKTPSDKEKYAEALAAGLILPLEGKSPAEKEKILSHMADIGVTLPEGRTPSEKALVAKVKAATRTLSILGPPSERLRKAKAAGLVTPLEGKTPEQKEKILRGLAMHGVPLPEPKTPSQKKLTDRLRGDLGLPPEPKTPEEKENYTRAQAAGLIVPLEGKTPQQKEKILKGMVHMGIPLPAGRTASEKSLIARVKTAARAPSLVGIPSEKLRKARAAGLLTPLEGKTPEQKEKILKGLVMHGVPLPTPKSSAEKKIVDKVRAELGLPPAPKTSVDKERYGKAAAAGILVPLEGKSPAEKENILRAQAEMGIPLPEGRTSSEKAMIQTIKATVPRRKSVRAALPPTEAKKLDEKTAKAMTEGDGPVDECICDILTPESERRVSRLPRKITSEKFRAAKAAGFLTPLEGKSREQKEKILKGLAKHGLPLPEAKTASEKKLVEKVRADLGIPPEPKTASAKGRYAKAQAAGLITPLEGKSKAQKEKILRGQVEMGLPLPEGRTAFEKSLIKKVKAEVGITPSVVTILAEKLGKARAAGLLTPLEGKTQNQKEKILKGRVAAGLPLPEGRTASDKKLIKKIKAETGYISPVARTPSEKDMLKKAKAAGLLTPLAGKSKAQKKKIIQNRIAAGLPIPEGTTPSEKDMIKKLVAVTPPPSLEGKSPAQKELLLRNLARQGRPLPEGQTASEKALVQKIRADMALPPPYKGLPLEKIKKAKAAGLLTPLEGKTPAQKEKILKGLAKTGIPLSEGLTDSEKKIIRKVRDEVGLPLEPKTPSMKERHRQAYAEGIITPLVGKSPAEKEKILKRMHDAGLILPDGRTPSEKELVRTVRAMPRAPSMKKMRSTPSTRAAGITEELEEITKTTVCEKACGCDKKKIRFKHSYVKIRVTSPDISSLCPCPDECIPGVKHGVFTDSEGIKVTVGSAVGVPSFLRDTSNTVPKSLYINQHYMSSNSIDSLISLYNGEQNTPRNMSTQRETQRIFYSPVYSKIFTKSVQHKPENRLYDKNLNSCLYDYTYQLKSMLLAEYAKNKSNTPKTLSHWTSESIINLHTKSSTSESSFNSLLLIKTESSLSFSSGVDDIATISIISIDETSNPSRCSHYLYYSHSDTNTSGDSFEDSEYLRKLIDYSKDFKISMGETNETKSRISSRKQSDVLIFRMSQLKVKESENEDLSDAHKDPIVVISYLGSDHDVTRLVDEIISQKLVSDASSIFVVVPTTERDLANSRFSSTICIEMSEYTHRWNKGVVIRDLYQPNNKITSHGFKISSKGKRHTVSEISQDKVCQAKLKRKVNCRVASMDTTSDRPCCCPAVGDEGGLTPHTEVHCVASVASEVLSPLIAKQGVAQGLSQDQYSNIPGMNMRTSPPRRVQMDPTPVRHCVVPSCSGHSSCHDTIRFGQSRVVPPSTHYDQARGWGPEELSKSKDKKGLGVGVTHPSSKARTHPTSSALDNLPAITSKVRSSFGSCATCGSCGQPTLVHGKLVNCACKPNPRKLKNTYIPNYHETPSICVSDAHKDVRSVGCQCCLCKETKAIRSESVPCREPAPIVIKSHPPILREQPKPVIICHPPIPCEERKQVIKCHPQIQSEQPKPAVKCRPAYPCEKLKPIIKTPPPESPKKPCLCSDKKKKKTICECPKLEELLLPEEEEIPELEPPSERELLKMKSDLTQTMSGFKLFKKRKPPPEEELSFEEALSYYKAFTEKQCLDKDSCVCDTPPIRIKKVQCECPEETEPLFVDYEPLTIEEETFTGLKFAIGGKGTGTKGLSGICCFDMIQQSSIIIHT